MDLKELTAPERLKYETLLGSKYLKNFNTLQKAWEAVTYQGGDNLYLTLRNSFTLRMIYQGCANHEGNNLDTRYIQYRDGTGIIFPWETSYNATTCRKRYDQFDHAEYIQRDPPKLLWVIHEERAKHRREDITLHRQLLKHLEHDITMLVLDYYQ